MHISHTAVTCTRIRQQTHGPYNMGRIRDTRTRETSRCLILRFSCAMIQAHTDGISKESHTSRRIGLKQMPQSRCCRQSYTTHTRSHIYTRSRIPRRRSNLPVHTLLCLVMLSTGGVLVEHTKAARRQMPKKLHTLDGDAQQDRRRTRLLPNRINTRHTVHTWNGAPNGNARNALTFHRVLPVCCYAATEHTDGTLPTIVYTDARRYARTWLTPAGMLLALLFAQNGNRSTRGIAGTHTHTGQKRNKQLATMETHNLHRSRPVREKNRETSSVRERCRRCPDKLHYTLLPSYRTICGSFRYSLATFP